jgi:3-deoxy-D-manno-octulosonic-acid transferase
MIQLYKIITTILYPLLILFIYLRKLIKKEDPKRFKEKIFPRSFNVKDKNNAKLIWFHAASIGEYKSIVPIIEELNKSKKNLKFLITTTTLSSGKIAEIESSQLTNVEHRYFPLDVSFLIKKFLQQWKPDHIFLVDSEIWPILILNANKFNIPIAVINARLTLKTFSRWMIFPSIAKKIFGRFNMFICSNMETKKFLEKLNFENVFFKGNIKFISKVVDTKINEINENYLLKKKIWFAASIHKNEDQFCLKTHLQIKKKIKDVVGIIAPRHIERSKEICHLAKKLKLKAQILNKNEKINEENEIIIINYFGALQNYFKYSKSVFIGKSIDKKFERDGGQNPIEAAKLNCKIYHGQYVYNFQDIYKLLEKNNISKKIDNLDELSKNIIKDLSETSKKRYEPSVAINHLEQKILNDTMELINNFLFYGNK